MIKCPFLSCWLLLTGILTSCHPKSCYLEPEICYTVPETFVSMTPSAFPPLYLEELRQAWGKELYIAQTFAKELDLYRAITAYKRSLILLPEEECQRKYQIEFCILQAYYLGAKYQEVINYFESSSLLDIPEDFPAIEELLILLYDSYKRECHQKSLEFKELLQERYPDTAQRLQLEESLMIADLGTARCLAADTPDACAIEHLTERYCHCALSVKKAQTLNALLPGAGYAYVGQKKAAITSFIINSLFIAASYSFFKHGYVAAGVITSSLEAGWYFGGINGAGLAAKEHNERLYEATAKETLIERRLFPVLMFNKTF